MYYGICSLINLLKSRFLCDRLIFEHFCILLSMNINCNIKLTFCIYHFLNCILLKSPNNGRNLAILVKIELNFWLGHSIPIKSPTVNNPNIYLLDFISAICYTLLEYYANGDK